MLEILASSTDGRSIRRAWLKALMERFDAPLGATQNLDYDPEAKTIRYADIVSVGPENWTMLDDLMDGVALPDIGSAEHFVDMNGFALYGKADMPPEILEAIWSPHNLASSLSTNVVEDGRMMGHISIFRTEDCPEQFQGNELSGEGLPWAKCSLEVMSATHAMLNKGPKQRGALLFKPDGTTWMNNDLPVTWASKEYRGHVSTMVRSFAASENDERDVHSQKTRIKLSRLAGEGAEGILVVVEPMAVSTVSGVSQLSPAERLVSSYAARGATADEIAVQLSRSAATIKSHLQNIYEQLAISSRAELAVLYEEALDWKP